MTNTGLIERITRHRRPTMLINTVLYLEFDPESGGIVVNDQTGFIPTREEMEDLNEWLQVFYDDFGDEAVDAHNLERHEKLNEGRKPPPAHWVPTTEPPTPTAPPCASKPGYIYLLHADTQNCFKIGRTNNLQRRLANILLPFPITLVHSIQVADMVWAERHLHQRFADKRLNGEWFNLDSDDVAYICSLTELEAEG
mgnify:CR=1 FL=1